MNHVAIYTFNNASALFASYIVLALEISHGSHFHTGKSWIEQTEEQMQNRINCIGSGMRINSLSIILWRKN